MVARCLSRMRVSRAFCRYGLGRSLMLAVTSLLVSPVLHRPDPPMQPRLYDPRVRFEHTGPYIDRWRLEKQDPAAVVSDVVHPIVFRLSASVPSDWVPQITRVIERWNPVFEAIGFRHAIVVRRATDPSPSTHDVVVTWDTTRHGQTGGVTTLDPDPRTGELRGGRITFYPGWLGRESQNVLLRGELDPRTPLPLSDSLARLLFDDVILHEAGHALGLAHNFKASGVYPTDSLRSPSFLRRMGSSASVMAYASGNYVAQAGDGVTFRDRRAGIGPYDRWTIAWGYRPIPEARTAEAERPTLDRWRAVQDTTPYLQSTLAHPGVVDPTDQPFTGGDDPVKSSAYGLRNLTRLVAALDPNRDTLLATHPPPSAIARSWHYRMQIAASVVGGATPQPPYPANLTRLRLLPVDSARQVQALHFVLGRAFYGQGDLIATYVLVPPRHSSSLVLFDTVARGWDPAQWQGYQRALLQQVVTHLTTAQGGITAALCQDLAGLQGRLVAATHAPLVRQTVQAQALAAIVAPAFAAGGACDSGKRV